MYACMDPHNFTHSVYQQIKFTLFNCKFLNFATFYLEEKFLYSKGAIVLDTPSRKCLKRWKKTKLIFQECQIPNALFIIVRLPQNQRCLMCVYASKAMVAIATGCYQQLILAMHLYRILYPNAPYHNFAQQQHRLHVTAFKYMADKISVIFNKQFFDYCLHQLCKQKTNSIFSLQILKVNDICYSLPTFKEAARLLYVKHLI